MTNSVLKIPKRLWAHRPITFAVAQMPIRRNFRQTLLSAFVLCSVVVGCSLTVCAKPNVILVMADDLGYEALGCYGGTSYETPVLDKLSATGMRFTHAYAQPLCTSTRVQLMTGKYNNRNWVAFGILDPREKTFGHDLQEAGYKTCIAGKWQLTSYDPPDYPGAEWRRNMGMHPKDAGFDEYCLWHTGHTEVKGSRYADPVILQNGTFRKDTTGKYGADIWAEYINDFITRHCDESFFVYFPMALTHGPFVPTPDSREWADTENRHVSDKRYFKDMVEYMDKTMGRIVARVDQLGLRENTLILFYSDNGTPRGITSLMGEKAVAGGKGYTTDAGTHVPLIANWPGTVPSGAVCDDLVDSSDFRPTLLDVADASPPNDEQWDGRSFLPQLRGEVGTPKESVYFHYDPTPGWDKDKYSLIRFVRDKRFKLYDDGRFFDISNDVLEQHPIRQAADSPAAVEARNRLQAVMDQMERVPNERADLRAKALGKSAP